MKPGKTRRWRPPALIRRAVIALASGATFAALAWLLLPPVPLYPPGLGFSGALYDRKGRLVHLSLAPDERYRLRVALDDISPHLISATLHHEDRHFYRHPGVNPLSLARSAWGAARGRPAGGASTITMQVVRLAFRLETRSAVGKLAQIARALQIERHYSKREILEAYFNLAPYGSNVEGAAAAALLWCGRDVSQLSEREAAALAVLPQSPARRRPQRDGGNAALAAAQHRLRRGMGLAGDDPLEAAFTLRPPGVVPREAPHLARRLMKASPGQRLRSTIDLDDQRAVERAIAGFVAARAGEGIHNACAILVDAPTREVRAYAGSAAFFDGSINGQVDGLQGRRSPGSALKPFIYALALDQGLIHPQSLLRDSKSSFGGYNPENFDRLFAGPVSARAALYHSRNVPAVHLAARLQGAGLHGFLKAAGVSLPNGPEHYGLALPLGGGEVTPEELAGLYALLADDGRARPLVFLAEEQPAAIRRPENPPLLGEGARFLTLQMLRPEEGDEEADGIVPGLSWKTGTSHGFRDAWTAGVLGRSVLVVWVGNFDGAPNPAFVARESAAPLLLDCLRELRLTEKAAREAPLPEPPPDVAEVDVCAVSGGLPTPHCAHRRKSGFLPGISPISPCTVHREVLIDEATGFRVAMDDGTRELRREVREFWPPDLLDLFRQAGLPRREPPLIEPEARALDAASINDAPVITSPREALVYSLRSGDPERSRIALEAECAPGARRLFWFADGRMIGESSPSLPLLWRPSPGSPVLHVIDDQGRSAARRVRIEMVD